MYKNCNTLERKYIEYILIRPYQIDNYIKNRLELDNIRFNTSTGDRRSAFPNYQKLYIIYTAGSVQYAN